MPELKRRHIFYIKGFDPRGQEFYHAMLRREARIAGKRGLEKLEFRQLRQLWMHGYSCRCFAYDAPCLEVEFEFLAVTDIIEPYFRRGVAWSLLQSLRFLLAMLVPNFFWQNVRRTPRFLMFLLYPYILLSFILLMAMMSGGAGLILTSSWSWAGVAFAACFASLCCWARKNDHRHYLFYLLGTFIFSYDVVTGRQEVMRERLRCFEQRVLDLLASAGDSDEVLIVGHSIGAVLAMQLVTAVARRVEKKNIPKLSLLTMGGQFGLGFFRGTKELLADIAYLANLTGLVWRDIYAPQDAISSGPLDAVTELAGVENHGTYSLHSACFKEALTPETYRRLRFDFLRMHMQYLRARERDAGFSFLKIVASPERLGAIPL